MNLKDSHPQEIFQLGLSRLEHSQLEDLLAHVFHIEREARPEDQLRFLNLSTINGIVK